jgi:hypothetical protein
VILSFRNGIVRHQVDVAGTPTFIRKNGQDASFIDQICDNGPIQFTIAHLDANYLFEENRTIAKAWGPLPSDRTEYLYWDVSLLNAQITKGFTFYPPYVNAEEPSNPQLDQHWFDTVNNVTKVWNGQAWLVKLRVFAGVYDTNSILFSKTIGTQCGKSNLKIAAGNIVLGKHGYPLRDSDGTFITTESNLIIANGAAEDVKFDAALQFAQASEFLPAFSLISYTSGGIVSLASHQNAQRQVNGAIRYSAWPGEIVKVFSNGVLSNDQWAFTSAQIGKPLFCGRSGEIVLTPPVVGMSQIVGYIYDVNAIFLSILNPIRL